jgi:hypothetical protein
MERKERGNRGKDAGKGDDLSIADKFWGDCE